MPSRNILKHQAPESFYHVYARGVNKLPIFLDDVDYDYFIKLIDRYLSIDGNYDTKFYIYPNYAGRIDINAYCLIQNHFHLLIYQVDTPYLQKFMQSIMTSYSRYFNIRHRRTGPVFGSRYKAVRIDNEQYLLHISRYIHLNPDNWEDYKYSSLQYFLNDKKPEWLQTNAIIEQFSSVGDYVSFLTDYEETHDEFADLKYKLTD